MSSRQHDPSVITPAAAHDWLLHYLRKHGLSPDADGIGFIRWKSAKAEGAVRLTARGGWQLLADPPGRWDRCANALVRLEMPRLSPSALDRLFAKMEAEVAQFLLENHRPARGRGTLRA